MSGSPHTPAGRVHVAWARALAECWRPAAQPWLATAAVGRATRRAAAAAAVHVRYRGWAAAARQSLQLRAPWAGKCREAWALETRNPRLVAEGRLPGAQQIEAAAVACPGGRAAQWSWRPAPHTARAGKLAGCGWGALPSRAGRTRRRTVRWRREGGLRLQAGPGAAGRHAAAPPAQRPPRGTRPRERAAARSRGRRGGTAAARRTLAPAQDTMDGGDAKAAIRWPRSLAPVGPSEPPPGVPTPRRRRLPPSAGRGPSRRTRPRLAGRNGREERKNDPESGRVAGA